MRKKIRKIDPYTKYARVMPSVVAMLLPCVSFVCLLLQLPQLQSAFASWNILAKCITLFLPLSVVFGSCGYAMREFFRSISKILFQYQFFKEDETAMPTTDLLVYRCSSFSENYIKKIAEKIKCDFGLSLRGKQEQEFNEKEARKEIANAVQLIRNVTREDKILLQYNIQFGFCRNLMGGLVVAVFLSLTMIIVALVNNIELTILLILLTLKILMFLLAWFLLKYRGRAYARQLFVAYITK